MPMDTSEFSAALDALIGRVEAAAETIVTAGGALVEAGAKKRAPVKTGTLRRSISTSSASALGVGAYSVDVGPSIIYARRIELGFVGADSLGRVYNQAPHPYFQPAVTEAEPLIGTLAESHWTTAIGG